MISGANFSRFSSFPNEKSRQNKFWTRSIDTFINNSG